MTSGRYGTFVVFAALLVIAPGPDFAVVVKNTLVGGRRRGLMTTVGIVNSNMLQGTAAAFGLGVVIVRSQALFDAVRWVGVAYLLFLGVQAFRSIRRVDETAPGNPADDPAHQPAFALRGWRQGFLSNITNPKVLAFYLSVLPQFVDPGSTSIVGALALAYTHALLSLAWLTLLVTLLHRVRAWIGRRSVRRVLHAVTGTALLGFGARLAVADHP